MQLTDVLVFTVGLVAVITGITQAAKGVGLPVAWAPVLELFLGIGFVEAGIATGALIVTGSAAGLPSYFMGLVYGTISGLTAAGLYTNVRLVTNAVNGAKPS